MHVGHVARLEVLGRLDHQLRWRILREHREVTGHVALLRESHRVIEALRTLEETDAASSPALMRRLFGHLGFAGLVLLS